MSAPDCSVVGSRRIEVEEGADAKKRSVSVQALTFVFEQSEAKGNARLVLLSIANHADRVGDNAWPSVASIALESRCARSTVHLAITELVEAGELEVVPRGGKIGSKYRPTNAYRLPKMLSPNLGPSSESYVRNGGELSPKNPKSKSDPSVMNRPLTVLDPKGGAPDEAAQANHYVALFVDEYSKRGTRPPRSWLGRVGKACRQMLAEETEPEILEEAVRRAAQRNRPGSIEYVVADIELERAGGGRRNAR